MDSIRTTANSLAIYNKNESDESVTRSADESGELAVPLCPPSSLVLVIRSDHERSKRRGIDVGQCWVSYISTYV